MTQWEATYAVVESALAYALGECSPTVQLLANQIANNLSILDDEVQLRALLRSHKVRRVTEAVSILQTIQPLE